MRNNKTEIGVLIENALDELYKEEYSSLICTISENHVSERACVFRFGIYFQRELDKHREFDGYYVDCEYNRGCGVSKRNKEGDLIVPDIILHKRGDNDNNLVVIEFKGWWNNNIQKDIVKIKEMIDPNGVYKYKEGYSIVFNKERIGNDRYSILKVHDMLK